MLNLKAFIMIFLLCTGNVGHVEKKDVTNLKYYYFNTDTYIPITIDNIDEHGCSFSIKSEIFDKILTDLLNKKSVSSNFKENFVRMKIETKGETYYVDDYGFIKINEAEFKLSPDTFSELKIYMDEHYWDEMIDCN